MDFVTKEFTLLNEYQVFGSNRIDLINNIGERCTIS